RLSDLDGLLAGLGDDDPLAGSQPAGLHDNGGPLPSDVLAIERCACEGAVARRRNSVAAQKLFRVGLRALELRGAFARSEALEPLGTELIDDTRNKGHLR